MWCYVNNNKWASGKCGVSLWEALLPHLLRNVAAPPPHTYTHTLCCFHTSVQVLEIEIFLRDPAAVKAVFLCRNRSMKNSWSEWRALCSIFISLSPWEEKSLRQAEAEQKVITYTSISEVLDSSNLTWIGILACCHECRHSLEVYLWTHGAALSVDVSSHERLWKAVCCPGPVACWLWWAGLRGWDTF